MTSLLSLAPRPANYYRLSIAALVGCGALAGAGLGIANGGTGEQVVAQSVSLAAVAGAVAGTVSMWCDAEVHAKWLEYCASTVRPAQVVPQVVPEPIPDEPDEPRYIETRTGGIFDRMTGGLRLPGRNKQAARVYATEVIGRVVMDEVGEADTSVIVDVAYGFWRMAQYYNDGKSTSEYEWAGRGRPFSLAEWRALRHWIIDIERLGYWRNSRAPKQGWELSHRARALLRTQARLIEAPRPKKIKIEDQSVVLYVRKHARYERGGM